MPSIAIRSSSQLVRLFEEAGRRSQFSTDAFDWLWDYLEQLEDDTGTPLEIDVIGLCCDYTEMTYDEIACQHTDIDLSYIIDGDDVGADEDLVKERVLDYLRDNTVVLGYDDDSVLFAAF